MAQTIWFDVTGICNWNGPPVGFVRAELETARHLLLEFNGKTCFCRYDSTRDAHLEVFHKDIEIYIRRLDTYTEGSASSLSTGVGLRLKHFIKRMVQYLPERPQHTIIRSLRRCRLILRKAKMMIARLLSRGLALFRLPAGSIERRLERGDVYITLRLDFESNIFSDMYAIKERTGIKVVGMCHDLIPVKFPHFLEIDYSQIFSCFIIDMARCADKILCNSRNTFRDLEEFLSTVNVHCPPLEVIRLGADIGAQMGTIGEQVRNICRVPYILFVSNIERRKNHEILHRAYKKLAETGQRDLPRLVFVGRPGWSFDYIYSNIRLDQSINGLILTLKYVNDSELCSLYRHALFTVYPSLYEGWGLPVAESLARGKFCIASSTSSLPEVGGDFVEYLDPSDLPLWVDRLAYYFDNPEVVRDWEENIQSHYRPPTWVETTRAIVNHALSL
ncbi:MAG: glycosyltransferase family 4 protein [Deltaproteobacteria bacterium]|nr:glycosyltransferase family 4 protein [Candidatus Zymogenaceae bacterium]